MSGSHLSFVLQLMKDHAELVTNDLMPSLEKLKDFNAFRKLLATVETVGACYSR